MSEADEQLFKLRRLAFNIDLLTRRNYMRVARWPGALAMALYVLCIYAVRWAGAPWWAQYLAGVFASVAAMWWLCGRAWRRYAWRQWNSLEA